MRNTSERKKRKQPTELSDTAIEGFLRDAFEANYARLRYETGHALSLELKEAAWQQIHLYWQRLHDLARRVTETEVRLVLPNQKTPNGRTFGIEGVVDIVQEDGRTVMYDLKTHDADVVRANLPDYAQQLNIYAHIWKHLRGRTLDAMAIIATPPPREVREAISSNDPEALRKAFENWKPVVPIPFSDGEITDNIEQFGKVVDAIESAHFDPPGVERLERRDGHEDNFAARVCANCDARHSCTSFLAHVRTRKLKPRRKLVERSSRRRETGK